MREFFEADGYTTIKGREKMFDIREMIKIDKKYQKSVNLKLDYNQMDKISSYIPTQAAMAVLKNYLLQICKNKGTRASVLIGPYGKGKSHLLLVLLALLSKENQMGKNKAYLVELLERCKKLDPQIAELANNLLEKEKYYLPVLVSGTQNDLNRSFLLALQESLKREHLEKLAPTTYFEEAQNTVLLWKQKYPATYQALLQKLEREKYSVHRLMKALAAYEENALTLFQKLYPELTAGSVFEPLVQMDATALYASVKDALQKQYGYAGIILIFDEFSKFVEGYLKERFSKAMEDLQNICELANSGKGSELHVILVAHKAMKEYKKVLPRNVINAYMGVEGRIREVYFTASLRNSYELIQNAIQKKETLFRAYQKQNALFGQLAEGAYRLPYFKNMFQQKEEFMEIVAKGCFPLTPVTAYLLLKISEAAVQNERTVFTFLTNDEPNSLPDVVQQGRTTEEGFVTAGRIYDYFYNIFKSDSQNARFHNEWLKAEYALMKAVTEQERELIKALALVQMVGRADDLFAQDEVLQNAAGFTKSVYETVIDSLKEKQIILFRTKKRIYAFKNNVGVNVEQEIEQVIQKKFQKIELCEELSKLSELEYELPKRYNQKYAITRYFVYKFIKPEQLLQETFRTKYLFEESFSDGKILMMISESYIQPEAIQKKLAEVKDDRLVAIVPKEPFGATLLVKKILAIRDLRKNPEFTEENQAVLLELDLYEEDLCFELNAVLEKEYFPLCGNCIVIHKEKQYDSKQFFKGKSNKLFNRFLSEITESYYDRSPVINNEQINKQNLSKQIKRARINLLRAFLEQQDMEQYKEGTSPEATIFRAVFIRTGVMAFEGQEFQIVDVGIKKLLELIRDFVESAVKKPQNFKKLYAVLMGAHYGVRKGVLPLYIVYEITRWSQMPVVYLGKKEVILTEQIFENINERPWEYTLRMEQTTVEKERYLQGLEKLFLSQEKQNATNRLYQIVDGMHRWFCALPQCSRNYSLDKVSLQKQKGYVYMRRELSKMDWNVRDFLFEGLFAQFSCSSYTELLQILTEAKKEMEQHLQSLQREAVNVLKNALKLVTNANLLQSLKLWIRQQQGGKMQVVYSKRTQHFIHCIEQLESYDESIIIAEISRQVLDCFIEDWKTDGLETFEKSMYEIVEEMQETMEKEEQDTMQKLSFTNSQGVSIEKVLPLEEPDGTSEFLQNEIESALDTYGDYLEPNQKVAVMLRMIEKILEE